MGSYYRRSRKGKHGTIVHYHSSRKPRTFADAWYGAQAEADNQIEGLRIAGRIALTVIVAVSSAFVLFFKGLKAFVAWSKSRSYEKAARSNGQPTAVTTNAVVAACPSCGHRVTYSSAPANMILQCSGCGKKMSLQGIAMKFKAMQAKNSGQGELSATATSARTQC